MPAPMIITAMVTPEGCRCLSTLPRPGRLSRCDGVTARAVSLRPRQNHGERELSNHAPNSYLGHKPFGCQSLAVVIHGLVVSCRTKKTERRVSAPTLLRAIGVPSGTIIVSPACATAIPSGVSGHCAPVKRYQASGPECRWTAAAIPGAKTTCMYRAVYLVPGFSGSGPMSATRSPPSGCQSFVDTE